MKISQRLISFLLDVIWSDSYTVQENHKTSTVIEFFPVIRVNCTHAKMDYGLLRLALSLLC